MISIPRAIILMAISSALLAMGCTQSAKAPKSTESMYLTPIVVLPSSGTDELARTTQIPSIASSGWVASRNAAILGGQPPTIQGTLHVERFMRDTQRINSGRPFDTLRYTLRTRAVLSR